MKCHYLTWIINIINRHLSYLSFTSIYEIICCYYFRECPKLSFLYLWTISMSGSGEQSRMTQMTNYIWHIRPGRFHGRPCHLTNSSDISHGREWVNEWGREEESDGRERWREREREWERVSEWERQIEREREWERVSEWERETESERKRESQREREWVRERERKIASLREWRHSL